MEKVGGRGRRSERVEGGVVSGLERRRGRSMGGWGVRGGWMMGRWWEGEEGGWSMPDSKRILWIL